MDGYGFGYVDDLFGSIVETGVSFTVFRCRELGCTDIQYEVCQILFGYIFPLTV